MSAAPTYPQVARSQPSANERLKWLEINGSRLAYIEQGNGEPVLFVHGGISDLRTWKHQIPVFAERFRAVAYSLRYAWPNPDIPDGVDDQLLPHADDLIKLIQKLEISPVHLVGNSWGGFICLVATQREPQLVRSLTVEEPNAVPLLMSTPPKPAELVKVLATRPATAAVMVGLVATVIVPSSRAFRKGDSSAAVRRFAEFVLGRDGYAELPEGRKQQMIENSRCLAAQLLGAGFPNFTADEVRLISTPTLLVTGEKSPRIFSLITNRLQERLPSSERAQIPEASHLMHEQNPQVFNRVVMDFVSRH